MFSATKVANFLACHHIPTLERAESRGEIKKPFFKDPSIEVLQKLGLDHERQYLRQLSEQDGLSVVQIDVNSTWDGAVAETAQAIRRGADAIYQATFLDGLWGGRSDFLVRVNTPSALGAWSYEVVETKLARSTKAGAIVQLCFYSDLMSRIQGVEPQQMHVVLGGRVPPERFPVQHYIAYFRKVRSEFEKASKLDTQTYPEPVDHCDVCSWYPVCEKRWRSDDYLSLVAGITRNQRKQLGERSVNTVVSLANLALPVNPKIERIGDSALERIHEQARIQVKGRAEKRPCYELLEPAEAERGLCALPPPSPGDVFLDLEANPYVLGEGLEYLIGMLTIRGTSDVETIYEPLWAFTRGEEKKAFETFMGRIMQRWRQEPGMHIYHYAPYETTAIERLAGRHGTYIDEVDELLTAGVFVDLYRVVRQGLRASVESYSIKRLEPLYSFTRAVLLREANVALNNFEAALALGGSQEEIRELPKTVEGYNRDDCVSAFLLRQWLEGRREELEAKTGRAVPQPTVKSGEAVEEVAERVREVRAHMARLIANLPADEADWTPENRACWLLAQMLEWHRREDKSAWSEYFRLCELSDNELQQDNDALGGLIYIGEVGRIKQSIVHRYSFPPQDHAMDRALEAHDPTTQKEAGKILEISEHDRTVDIKRGIASPVPHPSALIPCNIIESRTLPNSLLRLATDVEDHGFGARGQFQAAREFLLRRRPRALKSAVGSLIGEDGQLTEAALALVPTKVLILHNCLSPLKNNSTSQRSL